MPLANVTFCYMGDQMDSNESVAIFGPPQAHHTFLVNEVSIVSAPANGNERSGRIIALLTAFVDGYFAIGANPDATQATSQQASSARMPVLAGQMIPTYCNGGDKVAFQTV